MRGHRRRLQTVVWVAWSELVSGGTWGCSTKEGELDGHQSWPRGPSQFVAQGAPEVCVGPHRGEPFRVCSQKGIRTPVHVLRRHGSQSSPLLPAP